MALPRSLRFPIRKEGKILQKDGRRYFNPLFTIVYRKNHGGKNSRAAFIISKKISSKAVVRNKLKRQLSDIIRKDLEISKTPTDFLFIFRPQILKENYEKIKEEILKALTKIDNETMPALSEVGGKQ